MCSEAWGTNRAPDTWVMWHLEVSAKVTWSSILLNQVTEAYITLHYHNFIGSLSRNIKTSFLNMRFLKKRKHSGVKSLIKKNTLNNKASTQPNPEQQLPGGWGNAGRTWPCPVNIRRPWAVVRRHHLLRDRQRGALEVSAICPVVCEDKNRWGEGGIEGHG